MSIFFGVYVVTSATRLLAPFDARVVAYRYRASETKQQLDDLLYQPAALEKQVVDLQRLQPRLNRDEAITHLLGRLKDTWLGYLQKSEQARQQPLSARDKAHFKQELAFWMNKRFDRHSGL